MHFFFVWKIPNSKPPLVANKVFILYSTSPIYKLSCLQQWYYVTPPLSFWHAKINQTRQLSACLLSHNAAAIWSQNQNHFLYFVDTFYKFYSWPDYIYFVLMMTSPIRPLYTDLWKLNAYIHTHRPAVQYLWIDLWWVIDPCFPC